MSHIIINMDISPENFLLFPEEKVPNSSTGIKDLYLEIKDSKKYKIRKNSDTFRILFPGFVS